MSAADLAYMITAVMAVAAGLGAYFISRRTSSGRIDTTEAGTLWQQTQVMLKMLQDEKDKSEAQRDKMVQAYTDTLLPAITDISKSLSSILAAIQELKK